jgi:hypothetical protein
MLRDVKESAQLNSSFAAHVSSAYDAYQTAQTSSAADSAAAASADATALSLSLPKKGKKAAQPKAAAAETRDEKRASGKEDKSTDLKLTSISAISSGSKHSKPLVRCVAPLCCAHAFPFDWR